MRRAACMGWSFAVLFAATPAWAAEGGGSEIVVRLVNFAVVVGVLVWVFTRVFSLRAFFARRCNAIEDDLAASGRELQRAKERLAAIQERIRHRQEEVAALVATGDHDGEAEARQILTASREQAARVTQQVAVAVAQAERRLAQEVRRAVVERACTAAEGLIAQSIGEADQERLVEEVLS